MRVITEPDADGKPTSYVDLGTRKAVVVLEADKPDQLRTSDAGNMAIQHASAAGLFGAAIRNPGIVYTVGPDGRPLTDLTKPAPANAKCRIDITLGSSV